MFGVGSYFPVLLQPAFSDTMEIAATVYFVGAWLRALPGSTGLLVTGGGRGEDQNKDHICPSRKKIIIMEKIS